MTTNTPPDALLLLTRSCPNCPAVLQGLADLVKEGTLGRLEVVSLDADPDAAQRHGARAVPWVRLGPFVLTGLRGREELRAWARRAADRAGFADYLRTLLAEGGLAEARQAVRGDPALLAALLPIVADPAENINVRIGAGAVFEAQAGTPALRALVPRLAALAEHADARVRADALHYLGLAGAPEARRHLEHALSDASAEVREIAADGLAALDAAPPPNS